MAASSSSSSQTTNTAAEAVPCHLSTSQVDNFLHHVFGHDGSSSKKEEVSASNSSENAKSLIPSTKLTGRPVMIPMTGQAFVMGKLKPTIDPKTNEEQLQVNLPSKSKTQQPQSHTWTTRQVEDWLLSKCSSSQPLITKRTSSTKDKTKQPKITSMKQPQQQHHHQQQQPSSSTTTSYAGGFVDIHEEYTADGRPVKQEAINVTQQLQRLLNHQSSSTTSTATTSSNVRDGELGVNSNEGEGDDGSPATKQETKTAVTDDAYKQIMSRLDELALLEEKHNAEQNQSKLGTLVKESKKKSSSSTSGWNKGFLNSSVNTSKKTTKKKKAPAIQNNSKSIPEATEEAAATPTTTKATMKPPAPTISETNYDVEANIADAARVSFSGETHIKEIPRIGTRSTASLQPPRSKAVTTTTTPTPTPEPIKRSADSLFSSGGGVIRERPIGAVGERGGSASSIIKESNTNNNNIGEKQKPTCTTTTTRPLSRFARERQGDL